MTRDHLQKSKRRPHNRNEMTRDQVPDVATFDFSRLDRIPRSQLRALNLVHENFVRSLASSLSAYLRSYVALSLVSVEQVSYSEFLKGLTSPTCIAYLGLQPFDGTAVLEINMNLLFGLIELLLGSKGRSAVMVQRKITDIERNLVNTLLRVVLRELSEAWKSVAEISFSVQSLATEPQLLHVLAPAEAVIVIAVEVRIGTTWGQMNLAIPSIFVKRLSHKFDQLLQVRRAATTARDQSHLALLLEGASLTFEARIKAGTISTRTLMNLEIDDVLVLEHPVGRHINGFLNDRDKWQGRIVICDEKLAFQLQEGNSVPAGESTYEICKRPDA
ncbi:MAG: FliM/FliN family flagellar motor switch protein [Acidobacteriaceae bacterium]|nr:FliM/FliN family flagellar motor switch protein [Acidobacteriaceae bacterium]